MTGRVDMSPSHPLEGTLATQLSFVDDDAQQYTPRSRSRARPLEVGSEHESCCPSA
jgi:hypothetical protein